jgi:hypothetical protein
MGADYQPGEDIVNGVSVIVVKRGVWNIMPPYLQQEIRDLCESLGFKPERKLGYQIPYDLNLTKDQRDSVNSIIAHYKTFDKAQELAAFAGKMKAVELARNPNGRIAVASLY